jgi:hypothetical protein
MSDSSHSSTSSGSWFVGYGFMFFWIFVLSFPLFVAFDVGNPIGAAALCATFASLRGAGPNRHRNPSWLFAGLPGVLILAWMTYYIFWRPT